MVPIPGGKLWCYAAGTLIPQAVFSDAGGLTPLSNPVILDSSGLGQIYLGPLPYKFLLTDASGVTIFPYPIDNVSSAAASVLNQPTLVDTQTATPGQTAFALANSYIPGINSVSVFQNGAKLILGADYLETTPTAITLTVGASAGDVVQFCSAKMTNSTGIDAALVTYLPAGSGAVQSNAQAKLREVISVKDKGAAGDGITDDSAAFLAGIAHLRANGGGTLFVPAGTYLVTQTIDFTSGGTNYCAIEGESGMRSKITNAITGTTKAEPLIKFGGMGNNCAIRNLWLHGNSVVGAGGNGHAVAIVDYQSGAGVSHWDNQQMLIENLLIDGHKGFGTSQAGAPMGAAGVYVYSTLSMVGRRINVSDGAYGLHMSLTQKSKFYDFLATEQVNNCVFLNTCIGVDFFGSVLNSAGSGGATDGLIHLTNCNRINFFGGRAKNGLPSVVNLLGAGVQNDLITFQGMAFGQLDVAKGQITVQVGTGCRNVAIRDCNFEFVNTCAAAVGVDASLGASLSLGGLKIENCGFGMGSGGTMLAGIRLTGSGSYHVLAPVILGNTFGPQTNNSAPTTFTDCILLAANVDNALIANNHFVANGNVTITNCLNFASNTVKTPTVLGNTYEDNSGAITNKLVGAVNSYIFGSDSSLAPSLGSTPASTVGAAGGASALPASPSGYLPIAVLGTLYKIPYYAT
jgi:hypothetical protein